MIKEIISDQFVLKQKSTLATSEDLPIIDDLIDTIVAHKDRCVGIAANMIGIHKQIIVVEDNNHYLAMLNPKIIKTSNNMYTCQEGCLCHHGTKETKRYEKIKVEYMDQCFKKKIKTFSGFTAQIIQHEIDHCNGILI